MVQELQLTVRAIFEVEDGLGVLVLLAINVNWPFRTNVLALLGFIDARNCQRHVHSLRALTYLRLGWRPASSIVASGT
jgi:hypothetical protein